MLQRRILHIFPSFEAGGQQARVCTILNSLGSRFSHLILAGQGRHEAAAMLSPSVKVDLLPALPGKGSLSYPLRFRELIRKVQPDLVLTYNWGAFDGVLGAWLAAACPIIHAEDGFGSDEAERLKSRRVWSRRLFLNRISGLVVPSRTLADIARAQFRIRPQLVRWIPNGIDTQRFAPARNESLRHEWVVGPGEVLFGFVGRLGEEKNLDSAIRAVARTSAPGVRFVVIGDGPCRAALQSLAEELGLGARVVFAGASPDTAPVYGAFDAFLLSSRTEQMPMSLLEAMACGLPAVCADVGDCGEMLGTREPPYLVPRRNVEALACALSALAADPELRAGAGARNRKRVETQYSLGRMLAAYERIYETGSVSTA